MPDYGKFFEYGKKALGYLGKGVDVAATAATAYGIYDGITNRPDMPAPATLPAPTPDPSKLTALETAAQEVADKEKRRRALLLSDKSGTITNKGGYAGLGPTINGVGKKPSLLGGSAT